MALCFEKGGSFKEAWELAQRSLAIDERLSSLDPSNATWQADVVFSTFLVARLSQRYLFNNHTIIFWTPLHGNDRK
jgi:hypothetical protein